MDAADRDIKLKDRLLHYRMRTFDPSVINEATLHRYDVMMEEFEDMAKDLAMAVGTLWY